MTIKIRRPIQKLFRQHLVLIVVLITCMVLGGYWLVSAHAATPYVSVDASTGKTTGLAAVLPNASASNSSAVELGPYVQLNPTVQTLTPPLHFDNTQWNLQDKTNGYSDVSVDITPVVSMATTQGYYYSNEIYFNNYTGSNYGTAYAGLQTNGIINNQVVGPILIFSVWGATSGIAAPGGTGNAFTEGEPGYSEHLPYNWVSGDTYRLDIYLVSTDETTGQSLWAAKVTNMQTNQTQIIGSIYVPTSYGTIYGPVTFHERFSGPTASCSDIDPSQVSFTNMTADNGTDVASSWSHFSEANVPSCQSDIWVKDLTNGYTSAAGIAVPQ